MSEAPNGPPTVHGSTDLVEVSPQPTASRRVEVHHAYVDVGFMLIEGEQVVETRMKRLFVKIPAEALLEREAFDRAYDQIQVLRQELLDESREQGTGNREQQKKPHSRFKRFVDSLMPRLDTRP